MRLSTCLHQFFDQYLPQIKGSSEQSVKAYRETFSIFLPFMAQYHNVKIKSLKLDHLSANLVLSFLNHLETHRHNTVRTRNHRLAVIKSLGKMVRFMYPDKRQLAENILNIPQKRALKKLIGFLYPEEINKVFNAVDLNKKEGMRDYTILHLLFDSGARASEIATLNLDYFDHQNKTLAILGKGNRYRLINLWAKTASLIKKYILNYRIDLVGQIEAYKERFGFYPSSVHADKIYRNRKNIKFCKKHDIRLSGPRLGRPPKELLKKHDQQKQAWQDEIDRIPIEGKFGQAKRRFSLSRIMNKLAKTSETAIAIIFLVMNLEKWLKVMPFYFFCFLNWMLWGSFCPKRKQNTFYMIKTIADN